jgi:hypothetical protein
MLPLTTAKFDPLHKVPSPADVEQEDEHRLHPHLNLPTPHAHEHDKPRECPIKTAAAPSSYPIKYTGGVARTYPLPLAMIGSGASWVRALRGLMGMRRGAHFLLPRRTAVRQ